VHVSTLDNDYYRFDQVGQRLIGESGGQTYRLGDKVEVRVEAVNMDERKIDFSLISSERGRAMSVKPHAKTKEATALNRRVNVVRPVRKSISNPTAHSVKRKPQKPKKEKA
jgi:ribonuclease R